MQRQEAASATERKQLKALEILTRIHASQTLVCCSQGWGALADCCGRKVQFFKGRFERKKGILLLWSRAMMVT